jgi:glutaredoxin
VLEFTRPLHGRRTGRLQFRFGLRLALLVLASAAASVAFAQEAAPAEPPLPVDVYLFHGDGCPHCANAIDFLNELDDAHPTLRVHDYEVWYDEENRDLFARLADAYGRTVQGVPVIFLGDEMWTGFSASVERDLRLRVAQYETTVAPDPMERLGLPTGYGADGEVMEDAGADATPPPAAGGEAGETGVAAVDGRTLSLPLIGSVDLASTSLLLSTGLIAFVDGVNPCSLWVLALLLGVVLGSGGTSRRRVLIIGGTFLLITAAVYGAFIAGLFQVMAFMSLIGPVRIAVAVLAIAVAAVNIKDYVWFRRGFSLTIDDAAKPGIYKGIRKVVRSEGSWWLTLGATSVLALGVTLVELPCTAGLPVVWTTILADAGVGIGLFVGLLLVYMLIYLLDELAIFGAAVVTLRATRLDDRGGRVLKLLGGAVMLALAVAMLWFPQALSSLTGTLLVFANALGLTVLVLILHRVVHPASSPLASQASSRGGGD